MSNEPVAPGASPSTTSSSTATSPTTTTNSTTTNPTTTNATSTATGTTSNTSVPQVVPAWLANQPLNAWLEIPGSSGAGGAAVDAWGAFCVKEDTSELFIAASGGHTDSSDNRVVSIRLSDDAPSWSLRCEQTPAGQVVANVGYYADGKPVSRHLYTDIFYVAQLRRVMLVGARAAYGAAWDFPQVDGFNVDTNSWDAAGFWTPAAGIGYGNVLVKSTGEIFTGGGGRWRPPATAAGGGGTVTAGAVTGVGTGRFPVAWDATRNVCFSLQVGDGQGYGDMSVVAARKFAGTGGAASEVKFNSSSAYTEFQAARPAYASMDYDPVNDRFLFLHGGENGKVYAIKPNNGSIWDMSVLPIGGMPTEPVGAGTNGRFKYVPALRGFVYLPRASSKLWFIRVA